MIENKIVDKDLIEILYDNMGEFFLASGLSVSDFWMVEEDINKLDEVVIDWMVKSKEIPTKSRKKIKETYLPFQNLNIGPAKFTGNLSDRYGELKQGYLYVRKSD